MHNKTQVVIEKMKNIKEKNRIYQEWIKQQRNRPFIGKTKTHVDITDNSPALENPCPDSEVIKIFKEIIKNILK